MDFKSISASLRRYFEPLGLEVHPFKIGWYNEEVSKPFKLDYPEDTVAFVVISQPSMFEKAFLPYLQKTMEQNENSRQEPSTSNGSSTMSTVRLFSDRDPLDACLLHHFGKAGSHFGGENIKIIQDFEILPSKRPKILVQTAAHVAGAAYYYQKKDAENLHTEKCPFYCHRANLQPSTPMMGSNNISNGQAGDMTRHKNGKSSSTNHMNNDSENKASDDKDRFQEYSDCDATDNELITKQKETMDCICFKPWRDSKRIYGVCMHPKYGGWFAIRGVMIFCDLRSDIVRRDPTNCVNTKESRVELLNRFNGNWQDWTYRDVFPVEEKYSELQKKYFGTMPKDRHLLLDELLQLKD